MRRRVDPVGAVPGVDVVAGVIPVPAGGMVERCSLNVEISATDEQSHQYFMPYHMAVAQIPVPDPDTVEADPDTVWDKFVTKDMDITTDDFDIDIGAADTEAIYQFGEIDWNEIFNVPSQTRLVGSRKRILSQRSGFPVAGATASKKYYGDYFRWNMKGKKRMAGASYLMFAFGGQATPTSIASFTTPAKQQWTPENMVDWMSLQYPDRILEEIFLELAEIHTTQEAGESEAILQITRFMEQFYMETGSEVNWMEGDFNVRCELDAVVTVPGRIPKATLMRNR